MVAAQLTDIFLFTFLVVASSIVVFCSLNLTTGPATPLARVRERKPRSKRASAAFRTSLASPPQGGKILEYLGKLAQEFEPIATNEEISTPAGAVAIPMAIAVRGEVRVLLPVEAPFSSDRIDETLRQVALIRQHRYPEARFAFLCERALPLELALCASPDNSLGTLVSQSVLQIQALRQGRDGATLFREVFQECAGTEISYSIEDLEAVDEFLRQGEPVSGPITPGLRRVAGMLGSYLEWVIAGRFPDRVTYGEGGLTVRLDEGALELDTNNLALEALFSAGRLPLAGLVRDLVATAEDPFFIPREVSPGVLQRFPNPAELSSHRRSTAVENMLNEFQEHRQAMLGEQAEDEELAAVYECPCGRCKLIRSGPEESARCSRIPELEARLMDALQEAAVDDTVRCDECHAPLGARELALMIVAHPLPERGIDLWIVLDRLRSGKFWWHLSRLRRTGDVTHYPNVLAHSTFRRVFGRYFSVREAWSILFQRTASSFREERLRAERGLTLYAAPDGVSSRAPRALRQVGLLSPAYLVPLLREEPGSDDGSFLSNDRELRSMGVFGRPPRAWARARSGPFRRMFEKEVKRAGGSWHRRGLKYRISTRDGGESFCDLERAILTTVREGEDYLDTARRLGKVAMTEARLAREYVDRARGLVPEGSQLSYHSDAGMLRIWSDGATVPVEVPLQGLMAKTSIEDGSFDRFFKMAISQADLGVGLDVCGCGARAFVSKKLKPKGWPTSSDRAAGELARVSQEQVSFIYTRDCEEHSHYLSANELARWGISLEDLERRFVQDLGVNSYQVQLRAVRVDASLFFVVAGFNAASIALSGELIRGLLDEAGIEIDSPAVRFLTRASGCLVLGEPEASTPAFAEASRVAEAMLRELGEAVESLSYEGVMVLPEAGKGSFRVER